MTNGLRRAFFAATFGVGGLALLGMAADDWSINKGFAISLGADALAPFFMCAAVARMPKSEFDNGPSAKTAALKPSGP